MTDKKITSKITQLKQQDDKRKIILEQLDILRGKSHDKCFITITNKSTGGIGIVHRGSLEVSRNILSECLEDEYLRSIRLSKTLTQDLYNCLESESTDVSFKGLLSKSLRLKPETVCVGECIGEEAFSHLHQIHGEIGVK